MESGWSRKIFISKVVCDNKGWHLDNIDPLELDSMIIDNSEVGDKYRIVIEKISE